MKDNLFTLTHLESSYQNLPISVCIRTGDLDSHIALILNPGAFELLEGEKKRYKNYYRGFRKTYQDTPMLCRMRLPISLSKTRT